MKILDAKQIRALDAYTIQHEPIASIDLMERASAAFVEWFNQRVLTTSKVGVVCGTGNNGGDGLAIARMLEGWGYQVVVWIVRGGMPQSEDFTNNYGRLPDKVMRREITAQSDEISFDKCDVLIDAVFGSGLSRPPDGVYARVINAMNRSLAIRIAVDIPSGLMTEGPSTGSIVRAHYTITFQLPKLSFLLPETNAFTGEWVVVDIGLSKEFLNESPAHYFYTKMKDVRRILRPRSKFDHKGAFGHALLISGSYGKMGAAVLAARGALRAGIGLLTLHVPQCGYPIVQTAVPEAMAEVDQDPNVFSGHTDLTRYTTVGIGPGLGQEERTVRAVGKILETFEKPMVLDADALNILGANRQLQRLVPPGSVLTPHPKEFERMAQPWADDFERLEIQRKLAVSLKSVVVLKGAYTSIATEKGDVYFNSTGNPGMATGGTGDALTGIITGLLAQNYTPIEAAIAGVFLHGLAGDLAADQCGMESLTASDLIDHLPGAFLKVLRK